jgi:hypothetical protein
MNIKHYPPTEQIPRARRSSNVVCNTDVNSEAEKPATPNWPKVPKIYTIGRHFISDLFSDSIDDCGMLKHSISYRNQIKNSIIFTTEEDSDNIHSYMSNQIQQRLNREILHTSKINYYWWEKGIIYLSIAPSGATKSIIGNTWMKITINCKRKKQPE